MVPCRVLTASELGRDFSVTLDMISTAGDVELKAVIAQPMTLWIQQADKSYLPINGYVHTARRLGADGSFTAYQLVFASWMHFLRFRSDMRYWQDRSVDAIITDVFNQHPQAQGNFQFALSNALPSRSYCRQSESDWNFVHRLMEEEGLFGFWRQGKDGKSHTLVVTDDVHSLDPLSSNPIQFYRSGTGSEVDAFTSGVAPGPCRARPIRRARSTTRHHRPLPIRKKRHCRRWPAKGRYPSKPKSTNTREPIPIPSRIEASTCRRFIWRSGNRKRNVSSAWAAFEGSMRACGSN